MAVPKYNVIVKINQTEFVKYRNVTKLGNLENYCDRKFPDWRFINVYNSDEEYIKCIKRKSPEEKKKNCFNVIVRCDDGRYRKWKTSDHVDFLAFLNREWKGWKSAKLYDAQTTELWRHYIPNFP